MSKDYLNKTKRIKYYDIETKRTFIFLTNNTDLITEQITLLYKNRWQIELFFKWIKQHLKLNLFGEFRKCCNNTNLHSNDYLLSCCNCRT
ncbi:transposase [Flavivirga jejuensis]|uniref:transposase n=1 Tax=Flavivirga jejuensis TaxID=870487 RepID=UPI00349E739B